MADGALQYEYPGQYQLDGVTYYQNCQREDLQYIKEHLELSPHDVVVATYPKAGTTWVQEIIWSVFHGPNADKRQTSFDHIFPFIEFNNNRLNSLEIVNSQSPPRFIKTHLQVDYYQRQLTGLSPCPKFIVVLRDPKAALVSYYHHHIMRKKPFKFPGTWHDFFEMVKGNRVLFGDYFDHVHGWLEYQSHPNVMVLKYEDLKINPKENIREVAHFVGKTLTEEHLEYAVKETSFFTMKSRPLCYFSEMMQESWEDTGFIREGKLDSWKAVFTREQIQWMDDQTSAKLADSGLDLSTYIAGPQSQ